jgi:pyruvate formate-lyase activating enzyme-like uncharacterized protein
MAISPIWSRELTLKFIKIAVEESWDLAVHDCSNYTQFAGGLNFSGNEVIYDKHSANIQQTFSKHSACYCIMNNIN